MVIFPKYNDSSTVKSCFYCC